MRIGLLAPPWAPVPPPLYGGIELVVDLLARGFAAAGHAVVLFATGDSQCPVPTQYLLERAEGMRMGASLVELRHVLHGYEALAGCDVVHDHTLAGPFCAPADLPVVTTVHGPLDAEWADLYGRVARRAAVVCISHAQRRAAPELPVRRVIHHGIDADAFTPGDGNGGYALFLGRMSPDKGAERAILAAREAGVPIRLAAKMRDGAERAYFEARVSPLLGADATYLGEVAHEDKLALLAGASALLFPIRWPEPFGLVMLEALASGTPVVAFPEGAAPEVVDDGVTGFLVDSVGEMAAALRRIDTIDRAACRAAVSGRFSAHRMVAEHLELFSDVAR